MSFSFVALGLYFQHSIYHKFRQWIRGGLFEKILRALNFAMNKYSLVQIDSTFCKVHKHELGARKILGDQAVGVSCGGYNTKIHALVNEYFQLIGVILTGGQIHDCNAVIKHDFDAQLYKQRNIVERFFQRIKELRHIATRYDKLAICFLNFVLLASIVILFYFTNTP